MNRADARATDLTAPPELVSRGFVAVGVAALTWWADQDSVDDASIVLDLALQSLGLAASPVAEASGPEEQSVTP